MLVIFFLYFLLSVNLLFVYSKPYLYTDEDIILYLTRLKLGSQPSTTKPFNPVSLTSGSSLLPTDLGPKQNQDDLHVDQPSSHLLPICNPDLDDLQGIYCLTFINCYTNSYLILSKNLRNFFLLNQMIILWKQPCIVYLIRLPSLVVWHVLPQCCLSQHFFSTPCCIVLYTRYFYFIF